MPEWQGFSLLKEDSNAPISFLDFNKIVKGFSPGDGATFRCYNSWGKAVLEECSKEVAGSETAAFRSRVKEVGRLLVQMLEELCFPDSQGVQPHKQAEAKLWQEVECPLKPGHTSGGMVATNMTDYPQIWLGERREGGEVTAIGISLHRLACWAARGPPPPDLPMATHKCGEKRCCRLECLRWGDASSNALDKFRQDAGKNRPRQAHPPGDNELCWTKTMSIPGGGHRTARKLGLRSRGAVRCALVFFEFPGNAPTHRLGRCGSICCDAID